MGRICIRSHENRLVRAARLLRSKVLRDVSVLSRQSLLLGNELLAFMLLLLGANPGANPAAELY